MHSFDYIRENEEDEEETKNDDVALNGGDPRTLPFSYEGNNYCRLDCFFEKHASKPGMCMYVDKLATALFQRRRANTVSEMEVDSSDEELGNDNEDDEYLGRK